MPLRGMWVCSKSCSELELTPESLVLGIKLFCTEMAVQAQESSRPPSTDTYMADNTTVMLKGVSVQFRKKLQRMEILCGCSWGWEKTHIPSVPGKDQSLVWSQAFMCQLTWQMHGQQLKWGKKPSASELSLNETSVLCVLHGDAYSVVVTYKSMLA